ncbi:Isoleucine--tRNA ligase [Frankliniella fusca]|uniref:Isoleucine--tRNA ligase n=1 Tax=Frankliniella fusca TaxID=407009 RepID=A0AAE1GZK1_9NEOP|nr:Isoleucine--tRNA ligase [Frankliniella fusca]
MQSSKKNHPKEILSNVKFSRLLLTVLRVLKLCYSVNDTAVFDLKNFEERCMFISVQMISGYIDINKSKQKTNKKRNTNKSRLKIVM